MSALDKIKQMIKGHEAQAGKGVDMAGDAVDKKTKGKYSSQVDSVQDQAKKHLGMDQGKGQDEQK
ncbi:antitoxin [Streptomyces endophyticus]|uniref:Antitoxin n=1 Tax=Streptomyces endophyticus TaxID=714166 RepID=A0ABU6F3E3_9ACTN|nr:antitoxin [Streptomyces endophyticus]MEB8338374.1 antitoxin [Streptomyces endophyticus]